MWLKQHPWVFPIILGLIGLFFLIIHLPLIFGTPKDGYSSSGVPLFGGLHILIAGLISPCKWLAFLCVLDFFFIGMIYELIDPDAFKLDDKKVL